MSFRYSCANFNSFSSDELLQYSLDEDEYMEGIQALPLTFCIFDSLTAPLTATMVIADCCAKASPSTSEKPTDSCAKSSSSDIREEVDTDVEETSLSPFLCFSSSSTALRAPSPKSSHHQHSPIFFGPLGSSSISPEYATRQLSSMSRVLRSQSTSDLLKVKREASESVRNSKPAADDPRDSEDETSANRHLLLLCERSNSAPLLSPRPLLESLFAASSIPVTSENSHLHVTANQKCDNKTPAFVRLARVLVLVSILPEFQKTFPSKLSSTSCADNQDPMSSSAHSSFQQSPLQTLQNAVKFQQLLSGCHDLTSGSLTTLFTRTASSTTTVGNVGNSNMVNRGANSSGVGDSLLSHNESSVSSRGVLKLPEGQMKTVSVESRSRSKKMFFGTSNRQLASTSFNSSEYHHEHRRAKQKMDSSEAGKNLLAALKSSPPPEKKERLIVIDGANVAMRHGGFLKKQFSSIGVKLVVDYYLSRSFNVSEKEVKTSHDCSSE